MVGEIDFGALRSPDYFGNALRGQQAAQQQNQQNALRDGGQLLGSGDPGAAAQVYGSAGLTDEARAAMGDQHEADQQHQAQERQAQQDRAKALVTVAQGLKGVPPGQRLQALRGALPMFQQAGIDPNTFAGLTEEQLSDQGLDLFTGEVEKHVKVLNTSGGVVAVDERALGRNMADPNAVRTLYQDPLGRELKEAQIAATRARAGASSASADATRARAAKIRSSGETAPASGPVAPWERKW